MEGSQRPMRLRSYLESTGTNVAWLARRIGVGRSTLHDWVNGRDGHPMPEVRREAVLEVLRERADAVVGPDLFESEE